MVSQMLYGEDAEIKALENQNKILSAFFDFEKNNPKGITRADKIEVAKTVQLDIEAVEDVL